MPSFNDKVPSTTPFLLFFLPLKRSKVREMDGGNVYSLSIMIVVVVKNDFIFGYPIKVEVRIRGYDKRLNL